MMIWCVLRLAGAALGGRQPEVVVVLTRLRQAGSPPCSHSGCKLCGTLAMDKAATLCIRLGALVGVGAFLDACCFDVCDLLQVDVG